MKMPTNRRTLPVLALALILVPLLTGEAGAALVRPYPGYGNFPIIVDVGYRWRDDGSLDLEVMVEVRSGHLLFVRPTRDLPFQADLDVSIRLEGRDGSLYELDEHAVIRERTLEAATSLERVHNLVFLLENVAAPAGDLSVRVVDRHQERSGYRGFRDSPHAFSEMHCWWVAPQPPADFAGFSLGDPLFLRGYREMDLFGRRILRDLDQARAAMLEHLHLGRLYGLRQRYLQFACEIHPPDEDRAAVLDHDGLLVQIVSRELRFSMADTISLADTQRTNLGVGRTVMIFHQIDVQSLPPGAYLLSCASLDGKGRPWVTEFDVVWSMGVPRRRGDEELAVARLLLPPEEVALFKGADPVRRAEMLDAFWAPLDPAAETPQNEAWIEFQERVGYVRQHLGGFGLDGSLDPRAEVYLRMGTPSRVVFEKDPSNESLRTDPHQDTWTDFRAFVDSYQSSSTISVGGVSPGMAMAKTTTRDVSVKAPGYGQTTGRFPGSRVDALIGMYQHRLARHSKANTFVEEPVAETWFYGHGGFPLFPHAWSDDVPRGFRFAYLPDEGSYRLLQVGVIPDADAPDQPDEASR
ncbi:GWxTD domain-containing protein [bacterium]|nr:GWxTD domain-containing protein [bacterium]